MSYFPTDPKKIKAMISRYKRVRASSVPKLRFLEDAVELEDLRTPPGNRLEALKGDRSGKHSIRVNDQWRVCFRRIEGNAFDVEIVDYH